jgi:CRP-like cAMP-binding protein
MKPEMLLPVARKLLSQSQARGAQATHLSRALARGRASSWSEGELMCCEGDQADDLYLAIQGQVRVLRNDAQGVPRELVTLEAPTLIGHMALVDGSSRSASCEAVGDVAGLALDRASFRALMEDASLEGTAFRRLILSNMMEHLSRANTRIRSMIGELEGVRLDAHRSQSQEWRKKMRSEAKEGSRPSDSEQLRQIAGILDGWDMDTNVPRAMRFVEDEDMRRTRQAREKRRS